MVMRGVMDGVLPVSGVLEAGLLGELGKVAAKRARQTVKKPQRRLHPGVYKPAREVADEAVAKTAPENRLMEQLFGVTRRDLAQMADSYGPGVPSIVPFKGKPRGSESAENIMIPSNARRITDALMAVGEHPEGEALWNGMKGWYVMDPAYQRLVEMAGPEEGRHLFDRFNTLTGMASPGSEVLTELNRGTAANYYVNQRIFDAFKEMDQSHPEMRRVRGHPYHSTAQAMPMGRYLESGEINMGTPKVPAYVQASRERGRHSWGVPVGDAHFVRATGLADARGPSQNPGRSATLAEIQTLTPWWTQHVARQMDLEAVPAQALTWGTFAPQTGVDTPVGKPKLELLTDRIEQRALETGRSPEEIRDAILRGDDFSMLSPGLLHALGQPEQRMG